MRDDHIKARMDEIAAERERAMFGSEDDSPLIWHVWEMGPDGIMRPVFDTDDEDGA